MTPASLLQSLASYAVTNPELTAALLAGVATAVEHYRRTGKLPLGRLPWKHIQRGVHTVAERYFGRQRPRGVPALLVEASPSEVRDALRERHFESVDDASYEYTDEAWSFRRPEGFADHPKTGEDVPVEVHPRGFRTKDGGTLIPAHLEASRIEAFDAHIDGDLLSWTKGRDRVANVLTTAGFSPTPVRSERAADVTVVPPQSD